MKTLRSIVLGILLCATSGAYSQSFVVPANYHFNTKEDYAVYEKDIISAAKWLTETPLNEQELKRKEVSAFAVTWINGSPTVNVELNSYIIDFNEKNPGMLAVFMASCARYVLENNYSKDMRAKHRFALRAMMSVYRSDKGISRDKKMEKLIKSDEEGNIDEWLSKNLKIEGQP